MLTFKRGDNGKSLVAHKTSQEHLDVVNERAHLYLRQYLGHHHAEKIWFAGQKILDLNERAMFYAQMVVHVEEELRGQSSTVIQDFAQYKWKPVGIKEFICSTHYLNKQAEIYPGVLEAAEELNNGTYVEAVMTGGIGSGKTTLALYTNAYQLYLLSCMRSPHKQFGLDPSSEIMLIFQSMTMQLARGVDYQRFRNMIEGSPYFLKHYPFQRDLQSRLVFPNRVEVVPVSGSETAAIGQNVMGGLIDELNYMAVVEKSRVAVDRGTYDQAILLYNSIARRRKSRFMENGKLPGILCLVSSKKYPGQFTDQKVAEAERDPSIFVYDRRVWDIKPDDFGNQGWFSVFAGDLTRKPRIMDEDDEVADEDRPLVVAVPEEFRTEFEKDVINALREIAGVSTLARHPFFLEVDKVHHSFMERESIFSQPVVDFVNQRLTLLKRNFWNPEVPRFAHCDLALSGDSAGLAIGTVTNFKNVSSDQGQPAYMPNIWIDGVLEVRPPKNCEILLSKIREVIIVLKKMGLNIIWVTFDQFQSSDSQQILRQQGLITGHQSMDEVPCRPYDFLKTAVYEGRLNAPIMPKLQREMLMLEKDTKHGRVDHPPGGSKDCADALAGVAFGLTMRRELWGLYRIPTLMIPQSVYASVDKLKPKEDQPDYQPELSLVATERGLTTPM
jgi:hypothetical protein